jgi:hypothetical protein
MALTVLLSLGLPATAQPLPERGSIEPGNPPPEPLPLPSPEPPPVAGAAGSVQLGVVVFPITDVAVRRYRLPVRQGALVASIQPGSPADRAGIPVGAVIVAADGVRIDSPSELARWIQTRRPGQQAELSYYEGQQLYRRQVTLSPAASTPGPDVPSLPAPPPLHLPDNGGSRRPAPGSPRPLLDRLGRVLDDLVDPTSNPPTADATPASELAELRRQVQELSLQVQQLADRLSRLEAQLEP